MSAEPFDPNAFPVSDLTDHQVPNHRVKADAEPPPGLMGKLRGGRQATTPPKPPRERKPAPPYREGMFVEPVTEFYEFLAMVLMPIRPKAAMYLVMQETLHDPETNEYTAGRTGAQKCGEAWDAAAKKSESVRRFLDGFLQISVWGTLAMVHIPLIVALGEKADGEGMFSGLEAMLKQQAGETAE